MHFDRCKKMVDFVTVSVAIAPIIIVLAIYLVFILNVYDPEFEFPNPRGDSFLFDFKQLNTDTPDPKISGLYCRDDMMPIICLTTLKEQNSSGRQNIDPFPC